MQFKSGAAVDREQGLMALVGRVPPTGIGKAVDQDDFLT